MKRILVPHSIRSLGAVLAILGLQFSVLPCAYPQVEDGKSKSRFFDWENLVSDIANKIEERPLGGTQSYAKELGFKTDLDHPSWVFSELAYITQLPKEFDFEHPLLPPQFHYTGPFHDGKGRHPVDFPWDRLTGEPLIYASMGTIMNGRADVFRTIAAGVANHRGTQLVLSIGDRLDPKQIGPVPSNAIIVNQAPQLELLKRASVCITHAGLNTVLESLAQGVPQLAIPVTFEQPGVAARIAAKKTGVTMPFADLTSEHLSTLLDEVLNCSIYRENARKFQEIISKTNGLALAANIVERCFGVIQEPAR